MADKRNIIVGAARLFVTGSGFDAADLPAPVADTSYATTLAAFTPGAGEADITDVGYTQEGVEVSYEPDFGDVEVDQLLDSARTFKSGMRVTFATTFAEATLENLLIVWGQTADSLDVTGTGATEVRELDIQSGELGQAPNERTVIAVGNAPEGSNGFYGERTYTVYRALSTETSAHALRRAEATVFPVTFRLLPNDAGSYGKIRDRVRGTTWA